MTVLTLYLHFTISISLFFVYVGASWLTDLQNWQSLFGLAKTRKIELRVSSEDIFSIYIIFTSLCLFYLSGLCGEGTTMGPRSSRLAEYL